MTALVTGGSKGLGRAIAVRLAGQGQQIFVNYHADTAAAKAAADEIAATGATPHLVKGDVSTPEGAADVLAQVRMETDRLDQVVHAAVTPLAGPVLEMDPGDFTRAVTLNGVALQYVVQAALPLLGRGSSVFFLSSRGSTAVVPGYAALGSAKALGEMLIRYLAKELAPRGVRANTVSAGPLDTEALRAVIPDADARLKAAADANPSGRGLEFADVAETVAWLASPAAGMVQGQTVFVDGGLYL